MTITIRQLQVSDGESYQISRLSALKTNPEAFGSDYESNSQMPLSVFQTRATPTPTSFIFGAFDAEKIVGTVGYYVGQGKNYQHRGNIVGVFVEPDYRGQGIARKLFTAVIEQVKTMPHILQLHLGVGTFNTSALALYQSFGFEIYGTEPRSLCVNGRYIDEHHMILRLDT